MIYTLQISEKKNNFDARNSIRTYLKNLINKRKDNKLSLEYIVEELLYCKTNELFNKELIELKAEL